MFRDSASVISDLNFSFNAKASQAGNTRLELTCDFTIESQPDAFH